MKWKSRLKQQLNKLVRLSGNEMIRADQVARVDRQLLDEWVALQPPDLLALLLAHRRQTGRDCTFVQIGANDGIYNDPYRAHIIEHHLEGVLVEPLPWVFERLKENYRDVPGLRFANVAIGAQSGNLEMFRMVATGPTERPDFDDMASFSRAAVEEMQKRYRIQARIESCQVECLTLGALLDREGLAELSFLFIDVEGGEWEILRTIDFDRVRPAYIQFEHINIDLETTRSCYQLLRDQGYGLIQCEHDAVAIHRDACR